MAMLCWAASIVVVRDVAGIVPPAAMSFLRCLLALCILYPICRVTLHSQLPLMRKHWKIIGCQGVLLFIGGNGMLFVGLQFTTAINAALINSAEPVTIVAVAWVMFRERLTQIQWAGVLISMIGVIYLVGRGEISVLTSFDLNVGDIFIFISIVSWAFYAVLMRKVPPELDRLNVVFGILMAGAIVVFPFWVAENIFYKVTPLIFDTLWTTFFNAIFASILALFWWNHAVEGLGPSRAGLFVHLIPVYTVTLAVWLLGEEFSVFHAVGIGLIAIGIILTTMLTKKHGVHK
ncbi:MAG: DMT family transporter [Pseudomonadota bacterium]|nr:DMT family transporter [Pseudomonadota bacterium]